MSDNSKDNKIESLKKGVSNIEKAIEKINEKTNKIIFFVPDTKGQARASIINIYDQAQTLIDLGYNVLMLYEKNDHKVPSSWGKKELDDIPRETIENKNLKVGPEDIMIIPEINGTIVQETENLPLGRVIYIQSHEYMLDTFSFGKTWSDFGVFNIITSSDTIVDLIEEIGHVSNVNVVEPKIDDSFKPTKKPKKPMIAIYSRDQRKTAKIIKQFTTKYPLYRWISFRDAHGYNHKNLPKLLKECMLVVWDDDISTYGRFALEAIKTGTPVIGRLPDIPQDWMTSENGIWVSDDNKIADICAAYVKRWIEDDASDFSNVEKTVESIGTDKQHKESVEKTYKNIFENRLNLLKDNISLYKEKINELENIEDIESEIIEEEK